MRISIKLLVSLLLLVVPGVAQRSIFFSQNAGPTGSGGTVTIGLNSNTGNDGGGDQNIAIFTPILLPSGASDFTLNAFHTVKGTSAGNLITGVYSSTTSGCPAGVGVCPGTRLCQTASTASTAGDQTLTPSSCGTLTHSSIYWLATIASSNTLTYTNQALACPANGLGIQFATQGSFTLPASGGTTTLQASCFQNYAVLTCTGACGSSIPNYTVVDYSGGTAAGAVTAANLNSSTHGINGGWAIGGGGAINALTYQSTPTAQAFLNSAFVPANQTTYTGAAPGLVIKRITGSSDQPPNDQFIYTNNVNTTSITIGHWFQTDTAQNVASGKICDFSQSLASSGSSNVIQFDSNGTNLFFRIEQLPGAATTNGPAFSTSIWYWITNQLNPGGTSHFSVFDTTGTIVGSQVDVAGQGAGNVTGLAIGEQGTCFTSPVNNIWFGGIKVDPTGSTFPLLAYFPDSPKVIGEELSEMVRNGFIPPATIKNNRWWSYALGRYL